MSDYFPFWMFMCCCVICWTVYKYKTRHDSEF